MNLHLQRTDFDNQCTIGELSINGEFFCFVLEDPERGLRTGMTMSELIGLKVYGQTAITMGRYEVILSYSERLKKRLPLLLNVPGFEGIRIHSGNSAKDTEGCLLVGRIKLPQPDMVGESKIALAQLMTILDKAARTQKIFIEVAGNQP